MRAVLLAGVLVAIFSTHALAQFNPNALPFAGRKAEPRPIGPLHDFKGIGERYFIEIAKGRYVLRPEGKDAKDESYVSTKIDAADKKWVREQVDAHEKEQREKAKAKKKK